MANTYPINQDYTVSQVDHGNILILGNTSLTDTAGAYRVTFYPGVNFVGSFGVVARPSGQVASTRQTGFLETPYRRIYTDGVGQDYQLTTALLTGPWDIIVPANTAAIGLVVACTAGSGYLYKTALRDGDVAASTVSLGMPTATTGKVGADSFSVNASFTRPADTTGYTAGDVMANSTTSANVTFMTVPVAAYAGQRVRVDKMSLVTSQAACVAQVRAYWWNVPRASLPVATPADNAAMTTILANQNFSGNYYDLLPLGAEAGSNTAARTPVVTPLVEYQCAAQDTNLYVSLTTNTGYTPDSGQTFTLYVSGVRL